MVCLRLVFCAVSAFLFGWINCKKTYGDMFPHKHSSPLQFSIQGWEPDTSSWDELLYPPLKKEFNRRHSKISVHLTSNSPAFSGSLITFTAKLECRKEDHNSNVLSDCEEAHLQVLSTRMHNWTSWMDYYGFGKCTDLKYCDVFPDGKLFPQPSDRGYVYVWHTMGQYYETCDGSSSSLTLNTTDWTLGANIVEVLVYRKQQRRKYIPISIDSTVFWVTDKIPLAVNISQKEAANITKRNTFIKGYNIIFKVQVHDPSSYLKTADAVDFKWDFHDGNQLITHSNVATHTYSITGNITVKLLVQAAFRTLCFPATATTMHITHSHTKAGSHITTAKMETSKMETSKATTLLSTTAPHVPTTITVRTEPVPTGPKMYTSATVTPESEINFTSVIPTFPSMMHDTLFTESQCFHYMYGTFKDQILIIEPHAPLLSIPPIQIVNVSAAKVTNSSVNFVVSCLSSMPFLACTIVSDSTCHHLISIECDDVKPNDEDCQFSLKHAFLEPGTYCLNISLGVPGHVAFSTSFVTISNSSEKYLFSSSSAATMMLLSSAIFAVVFGVIVFMLYRHKKRCLMLEDAEDHKIASSYLNKLWLVLFPNSEERKHLLS